MRTKKLTRYLLLGLMGFLGTISACFPQEKTIDLKIWPGGPPDNFKNNKSEKTENRSVDQNEFGLNRSVTDVSEPSLSVHLPPKETDAHAAVLIFPGGGYRRVVIDKEGHDVARWLSAQGITGIVVKYRTAPEGVRIRGWGGNAEIKKAILSDAQEAMRIVRLKAKEWDLDSNKIGIMGFSAGGHLSALLCSSLEKYPAVIDSSAKKADARPDFVSLIYPALEDDFENCDCLGFPPAFIASASDDTTARPEKNMKLYNLLKTKNIPVEIHIYSSGGHGFGLGVRGGEVVSWKICFLNWLKQFNIIH